MLHTNILYTRFEVGNNCIQLKYLFDNSNVRNQIFKNHQLYHDWRKYSTLENEHENV